MNTQCECECCKSPEANQVNVFVASVHAKGGYWSAFDQGKLAALYGNPRASNPWNDAIGRSHVNCGDWFRGYDSAK